MNDGILYYDILIPFVDLVIDGVFKYNVGLYTVTDDSSDRIYGNSSNLFSSRFHSSNGSGDPFIVS